MKNQTLHKYQTQKTNHKFQTQNNSKKTKTIRFKALQAQLILAISQYKKNPHETKNPNPDETKTKTQRRRSLLQR